MNHLLIIDPQNDFCDLPETYRPTLSEGVAPCEPALPVVGAHADMLRIAQVIERAGSAIDGLTVTLDSHDSFDIGHPSFWRRGDGSRVEPFTQVTLADVRAGSIRPCRVELEPRILRYLGELESQGRYRHTVWPVHCELGTWGHNVHVEVQRAYHRWEAATAGSVGKILKGRNPYTEQYSAFKAEVVDPEDSATGENLELLALVKGAERVYIAGEASSHCVKATVEHLVEYLSPSERERLVLLTDCMSAVAGFEELEHQLFGMASKLGLRQKTAAEALVELRGGRAS
jgi:nicotinamidase-related amidase